MSRYLTPTCCLHGRAGSIDSWSAATSMAMKTRAAMEVVAEQLRERFVNNQEQLARGRWRDTTFRLRAICWRGRWSVSPMPSSCIGR